MHYSVNDRNHRGSSNQALEFNEMGIMVLPFIKGKCSLEYLKRFLLKFTQIMEGQYFAYTLVCCFAFKSHAHNQPSYLPPGKKQVTMPYIWLTLFKLETFLSHPN